MISQTCPVAGPIIDGAQVPHAINGPSVNLYQSGQNITNSAKDAGVYQDYNDCFGKAHCQTNQWASSQNRRGWRGWIYFWK